MGEAEKAGYLKEKYRFFHLHDTAGQERDFHYHDFDKLVFLLSGRVDYLVEDRRYTLAPGSVLFVKHHVIHKAVIDRAEPYERIILYLNHGYFEALMPEADLMRCFGPGYSPAHCYSLPGEQEYLELRETLSRCEAGLEDRRPGAEVLRDTYLMQLLVLLNRLSDRNSDTALPPIPDEKIRKTLEYIAGHPGEDLSVEALAGRVYLSRYHFMRLFKAQTGLSVHEYVTQQRLLLAARKIREGMPAGLAAAECGFGDYSTFSRAFRTQFGGKPSELK